MKTKVIVLVGNSGTGKSYIATHLKEQYGIPKIMSRTTRPRRDENDNDYHFVTDEEFDGYMDEWKICSTEMGGYRYTSLYSDITDPVMSHVVDESGLLEMIESHGNILEVFAVSVMMDDKKRRELISEERMMRDEDRIPLSDTYFDYYFNTTHFDDNPRRICKLLIRMYQKFND